MDHLQVDSIARDIENSIGRLIRSVINLGNLEDDIFSSRDFTEQDVINFKYNYEQNKFLLEAQQLVLEHEIKRLSEIQDELDIYVKKSHSVPTKAESDSTKKD